MILYTKALLKNALPKKAALGLLLAASSISGVQADNKLYFDSNEISIKPGQQFDLVIKMEVDQASFGTAFYLKLPEGISIVEDEVYDPDFPEDGPEYVKRISIKDANYSYVLTEAAGGAWLVSFTQLSPGASLQTGEDGELMRITLKAAEDLPDNSVIEFSNAKTSDEKGTQAYVLSTSNVSVVKNTSIDDVVVKGSADEVVIDASEEYEVTVDVENGDTKLYMGQLSLRLPEGLTMVGPDNAWATATDRVSARRQFLQCNNDNGVYKVLLMHRDPNNPGYLLNNKGHNHFLTFKVKADTLLAAESAIEMFDIMFTNPDIEEKIKVPNYSIKVTSPNAAARPAADAAMKGLDELLAAVEIADEVKDASLVVEDKSAAEAAVAAVPAAVKEGYMAGELDADPTPYADEVEAAEAAIAQLQKTAVEGKAKYDADQLQAALESALAAVEIPDSVKEDGKVKVAQAAAQAAVEGLENYVKEQYGDGRTGSLAENGATVEEKEAAARGAIEVLEDAVENAGVNQAVAPAAAALDDIIAEAGQYIKVNDPKVAASFEQRVAELQEQAKALQEEIAGKYNRIELKDADKAVYLEKAEALATAAEALKDAADAAAETAAEQVAKEAFDAAKAAVEAAEAAVAAATVKGYPTVEQAVQTAKDLLAALEPAVTEPFKGRDDSLSTEAAKVVAAAEAVQPLLDAAETAEAAAEADAKSKKASVGEALTGAVEALEAVKDALAEPYATQFADDMADKQSEAENKVKALDELVDGTAKGEYWQKSDDVAADSVAAAEAIEALNGAVQTKAAALAAEAKTAADGELARLKAAADGAAEAVAEAVKAHPLVQAAEEAAAEAVQAVENCIAASADSLAYDRAAAELAAAVQAADEAIAAVAAANEAALEDKAQNDQAKEELLDELLKVQDNLLAVDDVIEKTPVLKDEFSEPNGKLTEEYNALISELDELNAGFALTKDGVKEAEAAKIADLAAKAQALQAEAEAAQANEEANVRLTEALDGVQAAKDQAVEDINALDDLSVDNYPELTDLQNAIDELRNQVKEGYEQRILTASSTVPADSLTEAIEALVEKARKDQDSIDQVKAANYEALTGRLAGLNENLAGLNADIEANKAADVQAALEGDQAAVAAQAQQAADDIEARKAQLAQEPVVTELSGELDELEAALSALAAKADSLQKAWEAEEAAQQAADAVVTAAVAAAAELEAPEKKNEDINLYDAANAKAEAAQAAVAAALEAANALKDLVDADKAGRKVLSDSTAIKAAAAEAEGKLAAAKAAIAEAADALEAADAALAEEEAVQEEVRKYNEQLQAMVDGLTAPEKGLENKFFTEANAKVDDAQAAVDAAKALAEGCSTALAEKAAAYAVVADSSELIALGKQAVAAAKAAEQAIKDAQEALEAAQQAYDSEMSIHENMQALAGLVIEQAVKLKAPEAVPGNEYYEEANRLVADAQEAIAAAIESAVAFRDRVVQDVEDLSVRSDSTVLYQLMDDYQKKMSDARAAIKQAAAALEAAAEAQAEAEAKAAAETVLADLKEREGALATDVPQAVADYDNVKAAKAAADSLVSAAQTAVDALEAAMDGAETFKDNAAVAAAQAAAEEAMAKAEAAVAALEQAVEDATHGDVQHEISNKRYGELKTLLDDLNQDLDTAVRHIADEDADVAGQFKAAADSIRDLLRRAQTALETARDAYSLYPESDLTPGYAELASGIEQLVSDADAAQTAFDNARNLAALSEKVDAVQDSTAEQSDARDALLSRNEFMEEEDLAAIDALIGALVDATLDAWEAIKADADRNALADEAVVKAHEARLDSILDAHKAVADAIAAAQHDYDEHHKTGDVDEDTEVDINDYNRLLLYLKQPSTKPTQESDPELFSRLDVNGDGKISVSDAAAIINCIYYGGNPFGPSGSRVSGSVQETLMAESSMVGGVQRVALSLSSENTYVGYQFDVVLPEGASIADIQLSGRSAGHTLTVGEVRDGVATVVVSSVTNKAIAGTEGVLLYVDVAGAGEVRIENVEFADASARAHELSVAGSGTTGIAGVEVREGNDEQVFGIGGRLMNAVRKGISIIRRADGTTQKVIR